MVGTKTEQKKQTSPLFPGCKFIEISLGNFRGLDKYAVTPYNNKSAGETIIWYKNVPVWQMAYGGYYPKEVIPFLKLALQKNIQQKKFEGGRGPHKANKDNLSYTNYSRGKFSLFSGTEEIRSTPSLYKLGFHNYQGMSLL